MSLKAYLDNLKPEDRTRLFYAFDHGFGQYVKIGSNKFIGVNINPKNYRNFVIKEQSGVWSFGIIK